MGDEKIKASIALDIFLKSHVPIAKMRAERECFEKVSLIKRLVSTGRVLASTIRIRILRKSESLKRYRNQFRSDKVWLMAMTQNQYAALEPIKEYLPLAQIIGSKNLSGVHLDVVLDRESRALWLFKPSALACLVANALSKTVRLTYSWISGGRLLPGEIEELECLVKTHSPRCIIFANDHSPYLVALNKVAQRMNVPTVYIPHASTTKEFPPLDFDLALLPGQVSSQLYEVCGKLRGTIKIIGTPKYDSLRQMPKAAPLNSIGICFNQIDDVSTVLRAAAAVLKHLPKATLVLRPHPAMASLEELERAYLKQAEISDPRIDSVSSFLQRVNVVVAGNSGILLEARIAARVAIYASFFTRPGEIRFDYYGYLENRLALWAENSVQLCKILSRLEIADRGVANNLSHYELNTAEPASRTAADEIIALCDKYRGNK